MFDQIDTKSIHGGPVENLFDRLGGGVNQGKAEPRRKLINSGLKQ